MLTFLFWNMNRKRLVDMIARLVEDHWVDVLMLAENATGAVEMLQRLNEGSPEFHYAPSRAPTAVDVFTRFSGEFLKPTFESGRVSIRRMALPARAELLLAMVHLPASCTGPRIVKRSNARNWRGASGKRRKGPDTAGPC
jgi:hypothetical protein